MSNYKVNMTGYIIDIGKATWGELRLPCMFGSVVHFYQITN